MCVKETGSSTTTRKPRQKNIIQKPSTQEKESAVEPNGEAHKDTNVLMPKEA
jgi:hypothetical protein